jgi:molybdenum cofactor guanylyltransferase
VQANRLAGPRARGLPFARRTPPSISGILVAGGASRRMGRDKRTLAVDGEPLIVRVARVVAGLCDELVVATRRGDPFDRDLLAPFAPVWVCDAYSNAGPLAGIQAGAAAARGGLLFVVAVDMPLLTPSVLRLLVDRAAERSDVEAVVMRSERGLEPLLAVYRPTVEPVARALLDAGERRAAALLDRLRVTSVGPDEWQLAAQGRDVALNVNEPADLEWVSELHAEGTRADPDSRDPATDLSVRPARRAAAPRPPS